ncbi:hypothetical protein B0T16DRAFT_71682 [Cercophora newfieldiana]|uniref:Zn(2)-C6 fungal-type domain-containing protein n=1 Tax=Cercophora newfieldiana TaxID=92897 RepID=A0AA39YSZ9_9PEZI|nr:hypothetical protein B0T16DRAFT_71682 [Cercophora newfieldiana]
MDNSQPFDQSFLEAFAQEIASPSFDVRQQATVPRRLNFLKCHQCRRDKQKCMPADREWPGTKCDRCVKYGYTCSANVKARANSKSAATKSPGRCEPEARPTPTAQGSWSNVRILSQAANPGHNIQPLFTFTPQISSPSQGHLPCFQLFRLVRSLHWRPGFRSSGDDQDQDIMSILMKFGNKAVSMHRRLFYNKLEIRKLAVTLNEANRKMVSDKLSAGIPPDEAQRLVAIEAAAMMLKGSDSDSAAKTSVTSNLIRSAESLREAERWQDLIDTFGKEILLIWTSDSLDGDASDDEIRTGRELAEEWQRSPRNINLSKLVRTGSDAVYQSLKDLLLRPELQLKEACRRLNGVYYMVERLGRIQMSPPEESNHALEDFLCLEIRRRLDEVFGDQDDNTTDESESGGDSESSDDGDDLAHSGDELDEEDGVN